MGERRATGKRLTGERYRTERYKPTRTANDSRTQTGQILRSQTKKSLAIKNRKEQAKKYDEYFNSVKFGNINNYKTQLDKVPSNVKPYMKFTFEKVKQEQDNRIKDLQNKILAVKDNIKDYDRRGDEAEGERRDTYRAKESGAKAELREIQNYLPKLQQGNILDVTKIKKYASDVGRAEEKNKKITYDNARIEEQASQIIQTITAKVEGDQILSKRDYDEARKVGIVATKLKKYVSDVKKTKAEQKKATVKIQKINKIYEQAVIDAYKNKKPNVRELFNQGLTGDQVTHIVQAYESVPQTIRIQLKEIDKLNLPSFDKERLKREAFGEVVDSLGRPKYMFTSKSEFKEAVIKNFDKSIKTLLEESSQLLQNKLKSGQSLTPKQRELALSPEIKTINIIDPKLNQLIKRSVAETKADKDIFRAKMDANKQYWTEKAKTYNNSQLIFKPGEKITPSNVYTKLNSYLQDQYQYNFKKKNDIKAVLFGLSTVVLDLPQQGLNVLKETIAPFLTPIATYKNVKGMSRKQLATSLEQLGTNIGKKYYANDPTFYSRAIAELSTPMIIGKGARLGFRASAKTLKTIDKFIFSENELLKMKKLRDVLKPMSGKQRQETLINLGMKNIKDGRTATNYLKGLKDQIKINEELKFATTPKGNIKVTGTSKDTILSKVEKKIDMKKLEAVKVPVKIKKTKIKKQTDIKNIIEKAQKPKIENIFTKSTRNNIRYLENLYKKNKIDIEKAKKILAKEKTKTVTKYSDFDIKNLRDSLHLNKKINSVLDKRFKQLNAIILSKKPTKATQLKKFSNIITIEVKKAIKLNDIQKQLTLLKNNFNRRGINWTLKDIKKLNDKRLIRIFTYDIPNIDKLSLAQLGQLKNTLIKLSKKTFGVSIKNVKKRLFDYDKKIKKTYNKEIKLGKKKKTSDLRKDIIKKVFTGNAKGRKLYINRLKNIDKQIKLNEQFIDKIKREIKYLSKADQINAFKKAGDLTINNNALKSWKEKTLKLLKDIPKREKAEFTIDIKKQKGLGKKEKILDINIKRTKTKTELQARKSLNKQRELIKDVEKTNILVKEKIRGTGETLIYSQNIKGYKLDFYFDDLTKPNARFKGIKGKKGTLQRPSFKIPKLTNAKIRITKIIKSPKYEKKFLNKNLRNINKNINNDPLIKNIRKQNQRLNYNEKFLETRIKNLDKIKPKLRKAIKNQISIKLKTIKSLKISLKISLKQRLNYVLKQTLIQNTKQKTKLKTKLQQQLRKKIINQQKQINSLKKSILEINVKINIDSIKRPIPPPPITPPPGKIITPPSIKPPGKIITPPPTRITPPPKRLIIRLPAIESPTIKNKISIYQGRFRERQNTNKNFNKRTNPVIVKTFRIVGTRNEMLNALSKKADTKTIRSIEVELKQTTNRKKKDVKLDNRLKKFQKKKGKNAQILKLVEKSKFISDTPGEKRELKKLKGLKKRKTKKKAKPRKKKKASKSKKKKKVSKKGSK